MLFSPFASPRRLALLLVFSIIVLFLLLRNSEYDGYLPGYSVPDKDTIGSPSSLEEDQNSSFETPADAEHAPAEHVPAEHAPAVQPTQSHYDAGDYDWSTPTAATSSIPIVETTSSTSRPSETIIRPAPQNTTQHGPLPHESYSHTQYRIKELISTWTPPPKDPDHWPPYEWYGGERDYDPNRWEAFDWDHDFYVQNGIQALKQEKFVEAQIYNPYPDWNSEEWSREWKGVYVPCEGPRGKLLNDSKEDMLRAYPAIPDGFPKVVVGDANASGVDISYCFDRYHRYGPYGFGQSGRDPVDGWQKPRDRPDWTSMHWGSLQDKCVVANKDRWFPHAREPVDLTPGKEMPQDNTKDFEQFSASHVMESTPAHRSRTALLIRTWEGYHYTDNDVQALRALITELSLLSGGEYQVFLFVNIKDKDADIFTNPSVHRDLLHKHVPREFWDISILWNEKIFEEWYPKVGDWQVYWHQFMPLQWFSKTHPEFEFVWNWETDARYTGNHYQFLQAVADFAKDMPRKYMWERSSRFYFPTVHGTWGQFLDDTDYQVEQAMSESDNFTVVWGPMPYEPSGQNPIGPLPPRSLGTDNFEWGVGEEADLITLQPMWDPRNTEWSYRNKIWNFLPGVAPKFTPEDPLDSEFDNPAFKDIPRRVYINTVSRFSKRQLHAMHLENVAGRTTQAEMWPATVALHHGLKAVYAPHPIWTDRKWPDWYLDAIFNANGGETAQWGQNFDSPYNHDREHNFAGWSWYYATEFPKTLYRRWLGWKADAGPLGDQLGGKDFEKQKTYVPATHFGHEQGGEAMAEVGGKGRLCLPPMLLHPVKEVVEVTAEMRKAADQKKAAEKEQEEARKHAEEAQKHEAEEQSHNAPVEVGDVTAALKTVLDEGQGGSP